MKYTRHVRDRLRDLLQLLGYRVRIEKGNFQGGICRLEEQKLVVVNQFSPLEGQITALAEVLLDLDVDSEQLSDSDRQFIGKLLAWRAAA